MNFFGRAAVSAEHKSRPFPENLEKAGICFISSDLAAYSRFSNSAFSFS
ncbi:hypothetical protein [Flintibacter sp.]|jgi:polysaccharide deacetylase 2 family uncharacterized protein YibQ